MGGRQDATDYRPRILDRVIHVTTREHTSGSDYPQAFSHTALVNTANLSRLPSRLNNGRPHESFVLFFTSGWLAGQAHRLS
jgi:hypothetical protein